MKFTGAEIRFLESNELGRLATTSNERMPHVVPVSYILQNGSILIATDYETKKYRNIVANDAVAFLVDITKPNRGILIQGRAKIFERGRDFQEMYKVFHKKFGWVRADPWKEAEAPFVRIEPVKKTSWGL